MDPSLNIQAYAECEQFGFPDVPCSMDVLAPHALIGGSPGTTPLLRWAGSKKKLLPTLRSASPAKFTTYIEPFVGSGVLFLLLQPKKAILSDLNPHLVQAYEAVRAFPEVIWDILMGWPDSEEFYYELRAADISALDENARAARFVYLNRYCFNGVYRTNLQGNFNVARGKGNLGIPDWDIFEAFAARIKNVVLSNCDFESTIDRAKRGDFLYLDPPYAEPGKRDRGEYGVGTFKQADISRLLKAMKRADKRGVSVLLSYSAHQIDIAELRDWHVHPLTVMRNVSGFTGSRRQAHEVLISNYQWTKTQM